MPQVNGAAGPACRMMNDSLIGPWGWRNGTDGGQEDRYCADGGDTVNLMAVGAVSLGLIVGAAEPAVAVLAVTPSLSVTERYTTNVFLTAEPYGDFATFVSPGALLRFHNRSLETSVSYVGRWEYYVRAPRRNRNSQMVLADGHSRWLDRAVPGLAVRFSAAIIRTAGLPAFSVDEGVVDTSEGVSVSRLDTVRTRGSVVLDYAISKRSSISLANSIVGTRYAQVDASRLAADLGVPVADIAQPKNSVVRDGAATLRYEWSARTTWSVVASRMSRRVDPPRNQPLAPSRIVSATRVTPGFDYELTPALTVTAHAGLILIEDDLLHRAGDFAVVWEGDGVGAGVDYVRRTGTGGGLTGDITVSDRARARVSRRWTLVSSTFASLGYSRTLPATETAVSDFQIVSYAFHVGYVTMIRKGLTAELTYLYFDQRSEGIEVSTNRHIVGLTLSAVAPSWRVP